MSNTRPSRVDALKTPAAVFAALGDETRLSVLAKLCNGVPQSTSRLIWSPKIGVRQLDRDWLTNERGSGAEDQVGHSTIAQHHAAARRSRFNR